MAKAEETQHKILTAALELFRHEGYDSATMRSIAQKAGVATGAAYYYYPSKDAIIMDFYRRSSEQMQPELEAVLSRSLRLESRLKDLIQVKFSHFAPNRTILRALLRNGADPQYPLSPFSAQTADIRDADVEWFRRCLQESDVKIPRDLQPDLPRILWFYQMGVIFFWVIDDSETQQRTARLLDLSCRVLVQLIRLSALPLMRPVRKTALELVDICVGR